MHRRARLYVRVVRPLGLALLVVATSGGPVGSDEAGGNVAIERQGYFYVGGHYDDPAHPAYMSGQMYVEYQIPATSRQQGGRPKYPIIFVHGGSHTGAGWQSTPDGRPGWVDFFLKGGWPVYVVDQPGRARSPYVAAAYGRLPAPTTPTAAEDRWSASEKGNRATQWPQAFAHTQWPGTGTHGDPIFDQYYAHLVPGIANQEDYTVKAWVALLDKIGPSILIEHSQPGPAMWRVADMRPELLKAIIAVEPTGPPFSPNSAGVRAMPYGPSQGPLTYDPPVADPSDIKTVQQASPDGPGLQACWLQAAPARKLPRLAGLNILFVLSESSYHAPYDHCTRKYMTQAGVPSDLLHLPDMGIRGNGHLMAIEKNNLRIAGLIEDWLVRRLKGSNAPRTAARDVAGHVQRLSIAKQGIFFVGGEYNAPVNPAFMAKQMYVKYQIPAGDGGLGGARYPVVMVHGGGQQATTYTGTPDDRSGWADYFLTRGWPVYTVDQPGRGKSIYVDAAYGPRAATDIVNIEHQFTAPEKMPAWPQATLHTQWPGTGVHGDAVFDQFFASQYGGMAASPQEELTARALVALLKKIGPAVLVTHSQSGPHGWDVADAAPALVKAIVAVEPNGPPFYTEDNASIDRSWGITRLPMHFNPPALAASDLRVIQEPVADGPGRFKCWKQAEPPRQLVNLRGIPILIVTGEASFRAQYDHCTSKFLTQAGVANDHVRLEDVGIHGNGHMMMLEKNNLEIAAYLDGWLRGEAREGTFEKELIVECFSRGIAHPRRTGMRRHWTAIWRQQPAEGSASHGISRAGALGWLTLLGVVLLASGVAPAQGPAGKLSGEGVTTDVVYGHKAGMALTFDIYRPERPNGAAVISILSGGWRSDWGTLKQFRELPSGSFQLLTTEEIDKTEGVLPSHSYRNLMQKGYTVFAVRHGSSPNFNMPEIVGDVRRAVRFIRAHAHGWGIDPERIGVWGGSAGGHLSLLLATTSEIANPKPADEYDRGPARLAAVVAYAPPTDLPAITGFWKQNTQSFPAVVDLKPADQKEYSPIQHVSRDDPPTLIVHGDQDKTVPYTQGQSMYAALTKEGVASKLLTVEGAGHGFFGPNAKRVNLEMVAWFEKYLQKR